MIRPYLRDLINNHKPAMEDNEEDNEDNSGSECGEWKTQLVMQNNFISTKNFEDTRTIYSASKPGEMYMGSGTENIIVTSQKNGSEFTHESVALLYYYF